MFARIKDQESTAYAMLRIMAGFMYSLHGFQKLFGAFSGHIVETYSQLWFAGIIETVCGLLILVGLKAAWAAFLASGEMAVAYFQVHWQLRLDENFFPIVNHGELPALFCFIYFYIATKGAGKWSLDHRG